MPSCGRSRGEGVRLRMSSFFGEDQEKQLEKMIKDAEKSDQTNMDEETFGEF